MRCASGDVRCRLCTRCQRIRVCTCQTARPGVGAARAESAGARRVGGSDGSYGGQRIKGLAYRPLRRVVRACAEAADAVIATDRALEPLVLQHLGVEPSRLRLVPDGIDVAACDALADCTAGPRVRGAAQLAKDQIVLLERGPAGAKQRTSSSCRSARRLARTHRLAVGHRRQRAVPADD